MPRICEKQTTDFVPLRLSFALANGPSAHLSEGCRNICELKTKHLSHRCKPVGNMFESQLGSHSVFSNIQGPESDGHRLSTCNSNQMHVQRSSICCSLCLPPKFTSRTV